MPTKMGKITLLKDTPIPESRWLCAAELLCKSTWGSLDRKVILNYRGRLKVYLKTGGRGEGRDQPTRTIWRCCMLFDCKNVPHRLRCLTTWSPADGTALRLYGILKRWGPGCQTWSLSTSLWVMSYIHPGSGSDLNQSPLPFRPLFCALPTLPSPWFVKM